MLSGQQHHLGSAAVEPADRVQAFVHIGGSTANGVPRSKQQAATFIEEQEVVLRESPGQQKTEHKQRKVQDNRDTVSSAATAMWEQIRFSEFKGETSPHKSLP